MARIFNIYFTYEEVLHSAIVSVHSTPFSTEYILGNLDTDLQMRLPGNKIVLQGQGRLAFQHDGPAYAQQLMNAILTSLAKHVHGTEASY